MSLENSKKMTNMVKRIQLVAYPSSTLLLISFQEGKVFLSVCSWDTH